MFGKIECFRRGNTGTTDLTVSFCVVKFGKNGKYLWALAHLPVSDCSELALQTPYQLLTDLFHLLQ